MPLNITLHLNLKIYLLQGVLLLTLFSCDDKPESIHSGPYYLEEGKDYIYFEEGSEWHYWNSIDGSIDTVIMTYSNIELKRFPCDDPSKDRSVTKEMYTARYRQDEEREVRITTIEPWGCNPYGDLAPYFEINAVVFELPSLSPVGAVENFFFPFETSHVAGGGSYDTRFIQLHDTMEVQGIVYPQVAEFYIDRNPTWNRYPSRYYWSKGYGLIKKVRYGARFSADSNKIQETIEAVFTNVTLKE